MNDMEALAKLSVVERDTELKSILKSLSALRRGELAVTLPAEWEGVYGKIAAEFNQLSAMTAATTSRCKGLATRSRSTARVSRRLPEEKLSGFWLENAVAVNTVLDEADTVADQAKIILASLTDLKKGDVRASLPQDWTGVPGKVADAFNDVVSENVRMSRELERLSRVVGKEGRLKERAFVPDASGFWRDSAESINSLIADLVHPTSEVARVIGAVAQGDLSKSMALEAEGRALEGEFLRTAMIINKMVEQLGTFSAEVTRVAREVGTEGKLGGQADVQGVAGTWKDLTDSVNSMGSNLTAQVRNIAEVTTAVAAGDLSKKITVDVKGEILELKNTINTMVDQLRSFASEVTRVAREVGTEGKLGGQADVQGVAGTWKDLTDNVNFMAGNLTGQVRGIAKVVTAVANGDLDQKLTVEAKGEIAALADTINSMTDTLATFADQVTTVAREVGVEGKLGGQAKVPGAAGTWKGLTENVNQLAANLTTQVRAIAEVATAVTQGDLTRSITVEALGEVAALKDTINEMIRNLKDTTQVNTEQDWLKTNLAKFSRMLQGQKDLVAVGHLILSELAPVVGAQQAEFYVLSYTHEKPRLRLMASYASEGQGAYGKEIDLGQGLVGQCAYDKQKILLTSSLPHGLKISSGLTEVAPMDILVLPIIFEGQVRGVVELASVERFNPTHQAFLDQLTESIGIVINTIEANMRTEDLLTQSQSLAQELQSRQEELQQTNEELQEKAHLLVQQNDEVERKNQEVEQARQALEEKAKQLSLTSKYKSEFLANMSHELRTPLNSLLILSDQLCKNAEGNLTNKQVEFSKTIHSSGNDLLMLINDILDLSKIESGTVVVDISELRLSDLQLYVERTFRHVAEAKNVDFLITTGLQLPVSMVTDVKRLQQILKNLLSNAFKFTHQGHVALAIEEAFTGWSPDNEELNRAQQVLAFSVTDTGIGISADKQQIIFEAFQQADGSTSRKYGGTGLGLAISRELSRLLGGEIRLSSAPGEGSNFVLYLPLTYLSSKSLRKAGSSTEQRAAEPGVPVSRLAFEKPVAMVLDSASSLDTASSVNEAADDRHIIQPGDLVLLIVENDLVFASFLLDAARAKGFKGLVTSLGASALALAAEFKPAAMTLDIHLPDMDGWRVLDRVKQDFGVRHIPVCVISTDDSKERAYRSGAMAFVEKPIPSKEVLDEMLDKLHDYVSRTTRQVLVALKDAALAGEIRDHLANGNVRPLAAATLGEIKPEDLVRFECVITDDASLVNGFEHVREAFSRHAVLGPLPVVVWRDGPIDAQSQSVWQTQDGYSFREARSIPRVIDLAMHALHVSEARMSDHQRVTLKNLHDASKSLAGKRVLIVDDDMRNIFALATVLEEEGMDIVWADNGHDAIAKVASDPRLSVVLMDIMMPVMDGLVTMQEIRKLPAGKSLPVIAVTAKAMKGDREKCIEAGAWDYLSKPVNTENLLAVLRAWLPR
jgi:signal transduction histidine kinase/DNA-binding response OmpR family regulator/HAMP domain-containing protein